MSGRKKPSARIALPPEAPNKSGPPGLSDEISMLREIIRRVNAMADDGSSLEQMLKVLEGMSMSSARLATLLKVQAQIESSQGAESELSAALRQAIDRATKDA
jgi:hypothetical protein